MRNKAQFYKTLVKQEKKLQNKMDHPKLYNIRNLAIRTLLKSGIAIDYALPFIMSSIIVGSIQARLGITPLILDDKVVHPSIETIDTSSGLHLQKISYDFNYDEEFLDYKISHDFRCYQYNEYLYTTVNLKNALEFVDLIFDNNLDKVYFLRQYLKSFQEIYENIPSQKAKRFVR